MCESVNTGLQSVLLFWSSQNNFRTPSQKKNPAGILELIVYDGWNVVYIYELLKTDSKFSIIGQ